MSAVAQDINLEQGATFRVRIAITDTNNTPVDVSTWSAKLTIAIANEQVVLTDADGITMGNGTIDVVVGTTITNGMRAGLGQWDLFITDPTTSDTTKLYYGNVTVTKSVGVSP